MAQGSGNPDRGTWPVRRFTLESQPSADLSAATTAEERLAMMWPLAVEAWALTGLTLPTYSRSHTPVRIEPLFAPPAVPEK